MDFDKIPPDTGPALTIDLGQAGRLILPPRFTEQEVFEVKRLFYLGPGLEDAVAVGLHVRSTDGTPQGFALVYALQGRKGVLKAELPLRQHFFGFQECTINQQSALVILGISGVHFHDVWVYRFPQGKPELLLAEGSSAGVDLHMNPTTGEPQVWVGVENWQERCDAVAVAAEPVHGVPAMLLAPESPRREAAKGVSDGAQHCHGSIAESRVR